MQSVEQMWVEFENRVIAKDASSIQRSEMQLAFYAGIHVSLAQLASIPDDDVSDDGVVQQLIGWQRETTAFTQQYIKAIKTKVVAAPTKGG